MRTVYLTTHSHPNATPVEVAERIIEAKRTHPTWGPKKIVAWLHYFEPYLPWQHCAPYWTVRAGEAAQAAT